LLKVEPLAHVWAISLFCCMGRKAENPQDIDTANMPEPTLRVVQLLQALDMPAAAFAREIDEKPQLLNGMIKRKTCASLGLLTKIRKKYPKISHQWLFTGEGPMFKPAPAANLTYISDEQLTGQAPLNLHKLTKEELIEVVERLQDMYQKVNSNTNERVNQH